MSYNLEELNALITEGEEKLAAIGRTVGSLKQSRANLLCPFKVGDVLVDERGRKARVTVITPGGYARDYGMEGFRIRKDGTDGKHISLWWFYEWQKEGA